jgi:hypothetical protein
MKRNEEHRLIEAVTVWAEAHPTPNLPVLAFGNGRELTPRQIATHMRKRDEIGERLFQIFDSAGARVGIDEVIQDLFAEAQG